MITNKFVMYGCVVPADMEKLCIVWTCYMLVEFLNTISLLTTVVAAELLFMNIVFGFHVLIHVIHHIIIFEKLKFVQSFLSGFSYLELTIANKKTY